MQTTPDVLIFDYVEKIVPTQERMAVYLVIHRRPGDTHERKLEQKGAEPRVVEKEVEPATSFGIGPMNRHGSSLFVTA